MPDWLGALPNNDHIQCCWPTQCWWKTVLLSAEHKRCGNREGAFRGSERGGKAWVWWWMSRLLWDYDWWREKNCWYDGENEGSQTRSCSGGIKMFYLRRWKKFSVGRIMSLKLEMKGLVLQVVGAYTTQVGYQLEKEECWSNSTRITQLDITLLMSLTYNQQSENQQPLCFF